MVRFRFVFVLTALCVAGAWLLAVAPGAAEEAGYLTPDQEALHEGLARRAADLDRREAALDLKARELETLAHEIARRIDALEAEGRRISAARAALDRSRNAEADALARAYGAMRPREAAAVLAGLSPALAEDIAARLPPMKLGPILGHLPEERARDLTRRLAARAGLAAAGRDGNPS
ncbi:MotE family protein [Futiania mangrovi]|uniref:Magnesium transporter MgtE intracellular domain-containing protein n=1 Tax=Futiania mangrovi TaxID=2959716 RepID=A0A9J6PEI7_9PROT|nr:hypothetical protein [Futiania mangrovii]MCP1335039.1 hypothetical protein [Futiania mangrovii]